MTEKTWHARKKAQTRRTIQDHALALFAEKGFEATTVDEIAASAGVSHMTFFRHFPQKEAVVEYDEYDPLLEEFIAARPAEEPPLVAVGAALREGLRAILATDRDALLIRTRLVLYTPALRSRNLLAQEQTRDLIARALARRAGLTDPDYAVTVQAAAVLGAMSVAISAWAAGNDEDLVALFDRAFAVLEDGFVGRG